MATCREKFPALLSERLNASLTEVEGLAGVQITELRLPTSPERAPAVTLVRYDGPSLSEWRVRWAPPSSEVGCSLTLRGRKFGVSFEIVMAVGSIRLDGLIRCSCPLLGSPSRANVDTANSKAMELHIGFRDMPEIAFEIGLAGKALSLGSDTLRAWLQRQLERCLRARAVLPEVIKVQLNSPHTPAKSEEESLRCDANRTEVGDGGSHSDSSTTQRAKAACMAADQIERASREEDLRFLLSLRLDMRTIEGIGPRWALNEGLAGALGVSLSELKARRPVEAEDWEWATALVFAQLQLRFHDFAASWTSLCEGQRKAIDMGTQHGAMEVLCEPCRAESGAADDHGASREGGLLAPLMARRTDGHLVDAESSPLS